MSEFTQPVLGEVLFSVCSHSPNTQGTQKSPKSCPRGLNPLPCRRQSRDSTFWDPAIAPLQHLLKGALTFTHHLCPPPSPCLLPSSSDPGGHSPTGLQQGCGHTSCTPLCLRVKGTCCFSPGLTSVIWAFPRAPGGPSGNKVDVPCPNSTPAHAQSPLSS